MKDQAPLTPGELRDEFEKARAGERQTFAENGTGAILRYLSETVGALQAQGSDIRLVVRNNGHSNAYDMMYSVSGYGGGTIDAHGFIKCGETSHLFAVASLHDKKSVARLYISKNNVVEEGGRSSLDNGKNYTNMVIPGTCYDFNEDVEALRNMQKSLIHICAGNEAMLENDTADVFNKEPATVNIGKPSGKLKL